MIPTERPAQTPSLSRRSVIRVIIPHWVKPAPCFVAVAIDDPRDDERGRAGGSPAFTMTRHRRDIHFRAEGEGRSLTCPTWLLHGSRL